MKYSIKYSTKLLVKIGINNTTVHFFLRSLVLLDVALTGIDNIKVHHPRCVLCILYYMTVGRVAQSV